jgi:hypothetical protein
MMNDYSDLDCIFSEEAMEAKAKASATKLSGGKNDSGLPSSRGPGQIVQGSSLNVGSPGG